MHNCGGREHTLLVKVRHSTRIKMWYPEVS